MEANPTAISKCSNALQKLWLSKMRENKTFQIREIYNFVLEGEDILTHNSNKSAQKLCQHYLMPSCINLKNQGGKRKTIFLFHIVVALDGQMSKLAILPPSITFLSCDRKYKIYNVSRNIERGTVSSSVQFPKLFLFSTNSQHFLVQKDTTNN